MIYNQQYDIKCLDHPKQNIISICSTCPNNTPVCIGCITGIHNGHKFKSIEDDNVRYQIQQDINNQILPNLHNSLENNKKKLDESKNHFKQIQENNTNNYKKTFDIFKELKDIINAKENEIKLLLLTKSEENIEVNNIIPTRIENNINRINNAITYSSVTDYNNIDGFIELLKHIHQCCNLLPNINNNDLPEYRDTQLIIKQNNLNSIKDLNYIEVVDYIALKTLKLFTLYEGYDISHLEIPTTATRLALPNGFDQPLDFIPPTINSLLLENIKYQLKPDSIPKTVKHLYLKGSFDQPLDFIPPTVEWLYLENIKYQLKPDSIPTTVKNLVLLDGFDQPFDFIPPTVVCLHIENIEYQIEPDSIPKTVKHLALQDGFDQPLDFIPPTVEWLYLENIKYQLKPDSIPKTVKHLYLKGSFDQPLDFIPPTVEYLYLENIKYQLKPDSIPTTVKYLTLQDGFDQPLDFIPPTVEWLNLKNIKYQLKPDSIPKT
ncbi:hypothetical protein DICPUDRAFT_85080, partial [Dictyostelium purpureum]